MKPLLFASLVILAFCGCAQLDERRREREVSPQKSADGYTFKTWPGSDTTYILTLDGVTDVSVHLGPDFTVHYFTLEPKAELALYNGGHPQSSDQKPTKKFRTRFGSKSAEWALTRRESDYRAEAYVKDGEHSLWHLMVAAPTEQRVREVIHQLHSFRQQQETKREANVRQQ